MSNDSLRSAYGAVYALIDQENYLVFNNGDLQANWIQDEGQIRCYDT